MERDGFCRSVTSKLNYFLPRGTKGQEKKLCVRLPRTPEWSKQCSSLTTIVDCFQNCIGDLEFH